MDLEKSIGNLFDIIVAESVEETDKVDAYLTLANHCKTDLEFVIKSVTSAKYDVLVVVNRGLLSTNKTLLEATLMLMGHWLSSEGLVKISDNKVLEESVTALVDLMNSDNEKTVHIRCFWCLSNQTIDGAIISKQVEKIINILTAFLLNQKSSETVINGGLKAIQRLCVQCPKDMASHLTKWIDIVFQFIVCSTPKSRDVALEIIDTSMEFLLMEKDYMNQYLYDLVTNKGLASTLQTFFTNKTCHVYVLNTWACVIRLLGETFFDLHRTIIVNPMLKIAEKSFAIKTPEVNLALNNLWRAMTDVVFLRPDEFGKRMEKIFLLPAKIRFRNNVLADEHLKTQWHLICKINQDMNRYMEKLIVPLFDVYFNTGDLPDKRKSSNSVPEVNNKRKSISTNILLTPAETTIMLAADALAQLLMDQNEKLLHKGFKLESYRGPTISDENLKLFYKKLLLYVVDVTQKCVSKCETTVMHLWTFFILRLQQITMKEENFYKDAWSHLLKTVKSLITCNAFTITLILKILVLIPCEVLQMRFTSLDTSGVTSATTKGLSCLYIVDLLFHKNLIKSNVFDHERYFIIYERMINTAFSGVTGQLSNADIIVTSLQNNASQIDMQDVRWRLWSTLTQLLNKHISKTNDVNQGTATQNNFSVLLKILTFPLEHIEVKSLQDGTVREMIKTWNEIFNNFSCSVDLVPSVELNTASELLFGKVYNQITNDGRVKMRDDHYVKILLQLTDIIVKSMKLAEKVDLFSAKTTPTKVARKLQNPLLHFKEFLNVLQTVIDCLWNGLSMDGRSTEQLLMHAVEILEHFFTGITRASILTESCRFISPQVTCILSHKIKYPKILLKIEKLVTALFKAFETNESILFDDDTISVMENLLISCVTCERKILLSKTVKFWNNTFGKRNSVIVSNLLQTTFKNCKTKIPFIISGVKMDVEMIADSQDTMAIFENFNNKQNISKSPNLKTLSANNTSPIKVHGSFLKLGLTNDSSSKITSAQKSQLNTHSSSPYNNSPGSSGMKARRKLPVSHSKEKFVEIKEQPKKKRRLLTDHQKEVMRERKVLPVMYNNLDQSQDTALFSNLTQDASSQSNQEIRNQVVTESSTDVKSPTSISEHSEKPGTYPQVNPEKAVLSNAENHNEVQINQKESTSIQNDSPAKNTQCISNRNETNQVEGNQSEVVINQNEVMTLKVNGKHTEDVQKHNELLNNVETLSDPLKDGIRPLDSSLEIIDTPSTVCLENDNVKPVADPVKPSNHLDVECEEFVPSSQTQIESEITINHHKSCENILQGVNDVREKTPPLVFNGGVKADEYVSDLLNNNNVLTKEAKIVVTKLHPRTKRKRTSFLPPKPQSKKRRSEGDFTLKKEAKLKNVSDLKKDKRETKVSPVAERTRRKEKVTRHSTGSMLGTGRRRKVTSAIFTEKELDRDATKEHPTNDVIIASVENEVGNNKTNCASNVNLTAKAVSLATTNISLTMSDPRTNNAEIFNGYNGTSKDLKITSNGFTTTSADHEVTLTDSKTTSNGYPTTIVDSITLNNDSHNVDQPICNVPTVFDNKQNIHLSSSLAEKLTKPNSSIESTVKNMVFSPARCSAKTGVTFSLSGLYSPSQNRIATSSSPAISPVNSILKKKLKNFNIHPISPPVKSRRVSFQLPEGQVILKEDIELDIATQAKAFEDAAMQKAFTNLKNKRKQTKPEKNRKPVYPELLKCTAPIEKILPSLTFSRGIGHLVRAQNILTVGDLSALSEHQIENLPIRSPKVSTVRNALRTYSAANQSAQRKVVPKSPLFMDESKHSSLMDSVTPPKDDHCLVEEAALLATPSRHGDLVVPTIVKPTSLFNQDPSDTSLVSETDGKELTKLSTPKESNNSFDDIVSNIDESLIEEGVNPIEDCKNIVNIPIASTVQDVTSYEDGLRMTSKIPSQSEVIDVATEVILMGEKHGIVDKEMEIHVNNSKDKKESIETNDKNDISNNRDIARGGETINDQDILNGQDLINNKDMSSDRESMTVDPKNAIDPSNNIDIPKTKSSNHSCFRDTNTNDDSNKKEGCLNGIGESTSSNDVGGFKTLLDSVSFDKMSTEDIFDMVKQCEQAQMKAMLELRSRMKN